MKRFCCATKIMEGKEALERVTFELYRANINRVLVITDRQAVTSGARSKSKKLLKHYEGIVYYLTLTVGNWANIENVRTVYDKFIETKSEIIICIGGDTIAYIGKAVKALVNVGVSEIGEIKNLRVLDKVPLMLIPTRVNSIAYGAGYTTIFDNKKRKIHRLIGEAVSPNHIIIDSHIIDKLGQRVITKRMLRVVGIALIALSERDMSINSRVFSYAALDVVKSLFLKDSSKQVMEANESVIAGMVNASIGFRGIPNRIFSLMVMYITIRKDIDHLDAFMILLDSFLKLFGKYFEPEDIDMLGVYLEDEQVFQIKDTSERGLYVIGKFRDLIYNQAEECGSIYKLSDFGMVKEDLEIIISQIIIDLGDNVSKNQKQQIRDLMYSAY